MQSPSVQFSDSWLKPSQYFPPFLGGGAIHSRTLKCSHSGLHTDHSLHTSQFPSTEWGGRKNKHHHCVSQEVYLRLVYLKTGVLKRPYQEYLFHSSPQATPSKQSITLRGNKYSFIRCEVKIQYYNVPPQACNMEAFKIAPVYNILQIESIKTAGGNTSFAT